MFKLQRIISAGNHWTDNLFKEDEHLGAIILDKYGLLININRDLTLQEINLLIAQLIHTCPELLTEKIEIQKEN